MPRFATLAALGFLFLLFLPLATIAADETKADGKAAAAKPADLIITGTVIDEAGKPVAGAKVYTLTGKLPAAVITNENGLFRLPVKRPPAKYLYQHLVTEQDDRLGSLDVSQPVDKLEPVTLILKPARELTVNVTDDQGQPIRDARVEFLTPYTPLRSGRTDEQGQWTATVPADAESWAIYARKAGAGFDYAVSAQARSNVRTQKPLPPTINLKLTGAKSLRVRAVDQNGRPLSGLGVGPWYIQLPGRDADINLSGTSESWPQTDENGIAILDWLPPMIDRQLPVIVRSETHYPPSHATQADINANVDEITITLLPLERLSGRVTHADGRPAAGIPVTASGQGIGHNDGRGYVTTDADGRYEMLVNSEQAYLIAVGNKQWAAPYRDDVILRAGKPVEGIDFTLVPATRLTGTVTVGDVEDPAPKTGINVVAGGEVIPGEIEALRPSEDRTWYSVSMHFNASTDEEGRYELFLGPGDYDVRGPADTGTVKVSIPQENPPKEIVQNFHLERSETGPFSVQVVDTDGDPVSGVAVVGKYQATYVNRHWYDPIRTNAAGRLTTERALAPLVLYGTSKDGRLAGVTRVDAEAKAAKIVIAPTATASGRLIDPAGKPVTGLTLPYGIRIYDGEAGRSSFTESFGGDAVTDADGQFELTGLVVGETYQLNFPLNDHSWRTLTEVTPKTADPVDLGILKSTSDSAPAPAAYVPPTPEKRVADAFAAKAELPVDERIEELRAEADREYTRPLLLIGKPTDPAAAELYRLFYEAEPASADSADEAGKLPSPKQLRWEFELAALDAGRKEVAEELGLELHSNKPAMLVALNADGSAAGRYELTLGEEKQLDTEALSRFLVEQKLPTRDAEQMLSDALAKAQAEDKRVLLITSASWCGPCRMLSRFLAPRKPELDPRFIFVKLDIDRDRHAKAVRDRFQGDRDGGVPWFAILDADGAVLATSNLDSDGENIGYPGSDPAAITHFLTMFSKTAPELSPDVLAEMRTALEGKK